MAANADVATESYEQALKALDKKYYGIIPKKEKLALMSKYPELHPDGISSAEEWLAREKEEAAREKKEKAREEEAEKKRRADAADVARSALLTALQDESSEETLLAMITPEACRPDNHGEPKVLSAAFEAPVAVVAKIIEVTVKTYGRGPLTVRGTLHSESPLHHFAPLCKSEASLALLIAANPRALKCTDFEGDPAFYGAYDNSNKEIYNMLRSAETADGLARIQRLADEVKADLGQAAAAVARYKAGAAEAAK